MNINNENQETEKNFFKSLMDGDFGLAKTYWLYGVLIGNVGGYLLIFIFATIHPVLFLLAFGIVLLYSVVTLTGIWNSSNKYTGYKLWSILAKIAVVIGILNIVAGISEMLK